MASTTGDERFARHGLVGIREALRQRAAHAGPIDEDTLVYRIEFHAVTS